MVAAVNARLGKKGVSRVWELGVRFDDRFATVMALPADNPSARAAKWRQLVDLLAQRGDGDESTQLDEAYAWLEARRIEIDPATRREAARALAGRAIRSDEQTPELPSLMRISYAVFCL